MEGRKEKKVIIVAGEKRETPRRHHRVNMADMVTAVRGGERRGEERRGEEKRREERRDLLELFHIHSHWDGVTAVATSNSTLSSVT